MICQIDLSNFFEGAKIGAIFAIVVILYGGFCGFRNQLRRKLEEREKDRDGH
jgi:hypothetical protein